MAIFGRNEDKELKRKEKENLKLEEKKRQEKKVLELERRIAVDKINKERQYLNQFEGNYASVDFTSQELSNTDSMIISKIYRRIAEYANRHNLKICKISRIEDGALKTVLVSVIFEKTQSVLDYEE